MLLAWLGARGRLVPVPGYLWWRIAAAGTLLFLGCHGLLAWAEQRVTSGEAALFMASIPLWLVSLDAILTRRLPTGGVIAGLALGVLGVGVLASGDDAFWGVLRASARPPWVVGHPISGLLAGGGEPRSLSLRR